MPTEFVLFYPAELPNKSAGATRIMAFARMLKEIGYRPVMLGIAAAGSPARRETYHGIECEILAFPELSLTGIHALKRSATAKKHVRNWLDERRKNGTVSGILFSEYQGYASFLYSYACKHRIPLFFDAVEWYPREAFKGAFGIFRYTYHTWNIHVGYRRIGNIICISNYLYRHFTGQGCHCIRIPTIVDVDDFAFCEQGNVDKTVLAYAGVPWGKDDIETVMRAMVSLSLQEREKIELRLFGVTDEDVRLHLGKEPTVCAMLGEQICCFGRVAHEKVREELSKADFTVLLRESTRKNTAGFPTKLGESMAAGVPVIANLTSDIGLYLHDGEEGIVCEACSVEACAKALKRCLHLPENVKRYMRSRARKQARASFDYTSYIEALHSFIEETTE